MSFEQKARKHAVDLARMNHVANIAHEVKMASMESRAIIAQEKERLYREKLEKKEVLKQKKEKAIHVRQVARQEREKRRVQQARDALSIACMNKVKHGDII